jgi:DNA polymerase-3 subunit epsilon
MDWGRLKLLLEGKRELNDDETARLKQLWKKLVRMFHPDLHEQDPEKRRTYELLTQAINGAKGRAA